MSDQAAHTAAPGHQELFPISRSWLVGTVAAVVMVLLALVGVGLSQASRSAAPPYWICLVPAYAAVCMAIAWARGRTHGGVGLSAVGRQALHWLGIAVALALDFLVRGTGEESGSAAGLNALLLLALGCFLAGIHLEWLFTLVGVLLAVALVVLAKAEEYMWLIFVVGAVTIVLMVALRWLLHARKSPAPRTAPVATGS
jgi:hypothetical protein